MFGGSEQSGLCVWNAEIVGESGTGRLQIGRQMSEELNCHSGQLPALIARVHSPFPH